LTAVVGDELIWYLDIVLQALHVTLFCALGLISRIWMDLRTQRQAESPASSNGNSRRDAGNLRVNRLARAPAVDPGKLSLPARARAGGGPGKGIEPELRAAPFLYGGRIPLRMRDVHEASSDGRPKGVSHPTPSTWYAAQWVLRTRGGGGNEGADVSLRPLGQEHDAVVNMTGGPSGLPPTPSAPSQGWGSANAMPPYLSHTLERRGYTGTEEEVSEAASRSTLVHDADLI
jgi:hypothetical protein